jgi:hypothetical protein
LVLRSFESINKLIKASHSGLVQSHILPKQKNICIHLSIILTLQNNMDVGDAVGRNIITDPITLMDTGTDDNDGTK